MESKTKNRKTRSQIAQMVERAFPGVTLATGEDALAELKEGWFNAAYNVRLSDNREVILKIAPSRSAEVLTYEKDIMNTEVTSMRLAVQNPAIPVPAIYAFDTVRDLCDSDYFFMEKLSGENYEHVKASLEPSVKSHLDQSIGKIIWEINQFEGRFFGYDGNSDLQAGTWKKAFLKICDSVLDDGQRKNAEYGAYHPEVIRATILKHSSSLEEVITPRMVHWDAWDLNIFVKDGQVSGILDFERVLWGDPLMEAQFRLLDFTGEVSDGMRGYGKTSFTYAEEERLRLYSLHLALVMITECYYRNYDTDEAGNIGLYLLSTAMQWLQEN